MNSLTYFKKKSQYINTDLNNNLKRIEVLGSKSKSKSNSFEYKNILMFSLSLLGGVVMGKRSNKKKKSINIHDIQLKNQSKSRAKERFNLTCMKLLLAFVETKIIKDFIK